MKAVELPVCRDYCGCQVADGRGGEEVHDPLFESLPIVYTSVEDSGVLLTVRYLCKPRNRRTSENDLWERILEEFQKRDDIDLAYPTLRYYQPPIAQNPER